jgi:hypothetical protein
MVYSVINVDCDRSVDQVGGQIMAPHLIRNYPK